MFKKILPIFIALFVVVGGLAGYVYLQNSEPAILSPILGKSEIAYAQNLWFPQKTTDTFSDAPVITAQSALFVDAGSGQVLYQKDPDQKMQIASLTKIMTVILAMENKTLNDTFTVTPSAAAIDPDKMYLQPNEQLTLRELLDGIFLISANDAAETIAQGVTGNRSEFIQMMNQEAQELGMKETLFINPTGLEEDNRNQYSTAYDVMLMSHFAITNFPELLNISDQPYIYLPQTATHQDYSLTSGINLLTTYPGVMGFKTGYTPDAGLTLVTVARRGGKEVIGVLLNASDRREDARLLLDYSFKELGV